jgi:hypothetical protein
MSLGLGLADPPRRPTPAQRQAMRLSPPGLKANPPQILLVDLPVDWIAVLEQEE